MLMCLGRSECNYAIARRDYEERYSRAQGLRVPSERTFQRLHNRVYNTGSVHGDEAHQIDAGRPRRPDNLEQQVLDVFAADPTQSTRCVARDLGTYHLRVWKILKEDGQHTYHYQRVQSHMPSDYEPRRIYCSWVLNKIQEDPDFLRNVLFTDECSFERTGVFNSRNEHVWALENPHAMKQSHFQHRWRINVWAGILGDRIIGPYFLNHTMNGENYLMFLRELLSEELDELPLSVHRALWFQHDGAPPHFLRAVREYLNAQFPNKWIGRGGPIAWPPRSPDLTPLDFYLWGHVKQLVYNTICDTEMEMRDRIVMVFNNLKTNSTILRSVSNHIQKRCRKCVNVGGGYVEHNRQELQAVDVFVN